MRKFLSILIISLLLGTALAVELTSEGEFILTSTDGTIVGAGELEAGNLQLQLLAGFTGFATLTVIDEEGTITTYDVMVSEDNAVIFTESLEELSGVVTSAGGETEVTIREEVETEGNQAFGAAVPENVQLPEEAREGMEEARENYAEAQERAAEAQEEAAERAADARENAGERDEGADEAEDSTDEVERPDDADDAAEEGTGRAEEGRNKAR